MTYAIESGVGGEYCLSTYNPETGETRSSGWFPNLITNLGMDRIGASAVLFSQAVVGTGNTPPAFTDVALVAYTATSTSNPSNSASNSGAPNYIGTSSTTYEFALGSVVGNMAEVGVSHVAGGGSLFSRALIVDAGGAPTTFTVFASEILQVTYRMSVYPKLTDTIGSVTISGTTYTTTTRTSQASSIDAAFIKSGLQFAAGCTVYAGTIGTITGGPSGSNLGSGGIGTALAAYTNGSYFRDCTLSASIGLWNLAGGIRSISFIWSTLSGGYAAVYQVDFGASIPKDATKTMSLTLRFAWARH